jgi:class 3 adenylate cyclase
MCARSASASRPIRNRVGDARAYGWVREHYAVLTRAVREHDGAVVKTIGDAVMAAFSSPANGLTAALAICERIAEFDRGWRRKPVRAGPFRSRSTCTAGHALL